MNEDADEDIFEDYSKGNFAILLTLSLPCRAIKSH
jgi:hypothetical protein